jgi:dienelactone hydrolase
MVGLLLIALTAIFPACSPPAKQIIINSTLEDDDRPFPTLKGYLTVPHSNGPLPALVLMHGGSGLVQQIYRPWAKRLSQWGYVVLQVDSFSGRGISSDNNYGGVPYDRLISGRACDARDARDYLAQLSMVDSSRIGVIGWSQGGAVVNAIASRDRHKGAFGAAVAFYPLCYSKIKDIHTPLLILMGEKDNVCHPYLCRMMLPFSEASRELVFKTYTGAHHGFDIKGADVQKNRGSRAGFRMEFHQQAAEDAFDTVKAFFDKHLDQSGR